jgi:hypothetical protein
MHMLQTRLIQTMLLVVEFKQRKKSGERNKVQSSIASHVSMENHIHTQNRHRNLRGKAKLWIPRSLPEIPPHSTMEPPIVEIVESISRVLRA